MCLITFAYKTHPKYRLILAANRDELYARPTLPADYWPDEPDILGGRDLQAGGSWLSINKAGRFAAVTNFREGISEPQSLSRGQLIHDFLTTDTTPQQFSDNLLARRHNYGGYNLLLATADSLFYTSNRTDLATELSPGIYSLSNHLLDTPWPKSLHVKNALKQLLDKEQLSPSSLLAIMQHREQFEDQLLPSTGVGIEMERTLSSPFIETDEYGTRCSTIVLWSYQGDMTFGEQAYQPGNSLGEYQEFNIRLS